jgi:ABC-type multidrug transport system fused ATPase/permease subunit
LKDYIKYIRSILSDWERKRFTSLVVLNFLVNALDIASLAILVFVIDFYTQPATHPRPGFLPAELLNNNSIALILLFFLFFACKNFAAYAIQKRQNRFIYNVATRIANNNLLKYLEGTYSNFISRDSGSHSWRVALQPFEFSQYVLAGIQQIFTEAILVVMAVVAIFWFNAQLFLLLLAFLVPPVIIISYMLRKKLNRVRSQIKQSREKMWLHLQEAVTGFVDSNVYEKNDHFVARFSWYQQILNNHISNMQVVQALPSRFIEIFAIFGMLALIMIGKSTQIQSHIDVITLGAFVAAAYKVIPGIVKIINLSNQVKNYAFTLEDLQQPYAGRSAKPVSPKIESIQFWNVSYWNNNNCTFKNFNLHLSPGDFIGISGVSGKGKTTLLNLLLGFLHQQQGDILINQKITTSTDRKLYWNRIAYVQQQPFLIHDTVVSNITLNGEHYDTERMAKVIKVTGISGWLENQGSGLAHLITENGKNISGGQRKRIALARALYKEADLYLLDEAFSELDAESEQAMLHYFKQLAESGKMVVLISHNKSSFSHCNKIISLDEA